MASAREPRLLVVTPAWNEQECVAATVAAIRDAVPTADIVVIDDGSTDHTGRLARAAGATVLTLPFNLGVGAAMRTGFRYAEHHNLTWSSRSTPTVSRIHAKSAPSSLHWPCSQRPRAVMSSSEHDSSEPPRTGCVAHVGGRWRCSPARCPG